MSCFPFAAGVVRYPWGREANRLLIRVVTTGRVVVGKCGTVDNQPQRTENSHNPVGNGIRILTVFVWCFLIVLVCLIPCATEAAQVPDDTTAWFTDLSYPNRLPPTDQPNGDLLCAPDSVREYWYDHSEGRRTGILNGRDAAFGPIAINLNCYNPLAKDSNVSIRFRVVSDNTAGAANLDEFPLSCWKQQFDMHSERTSLQVEKPVYVPRGSRGRIEVRTYRGDLLISTDSYQYDSIPDTGGLSLDIFHSVILSFIDPVGSLPAVDTWIRLISVGGDTDSNPSGTLSAIKEHWERGLMNNHRLLRVEKLGNIESIEYSGQNFDAVLSREFGISSGKTSQARRRINIYLVRPENINLHPSSLSNVTRAISQHMNLKYEPLDGGGGWCVWRPLLIPHQSSSSDVSWRDVLNYTYQVSNQAGTPTRLSKWDVPEGLDAIQASAWQLRHFLFEQCFRFGLDWKSEESGSRLSFGLAFQLFVPPDSAGKWVFFVLSDGSSGVGVEQIKKVISVNADPILKHDGIGWVLEIDPIRTERNPLTVSFEIRHEDLHEYDDLECMLVYCPDGAVYADFGELYRRNSTQPKAVYRLHVMRTKSDADRETMIKSFCTTASESGMSCYPKTWTKKTHLPPVVTDRSSDIADTLDMSYREKNFRERQWKLTSNVSAAVKYRLNHEDPSLMGNTNAIIDMNAYQYLTAPTRYGEDAWFGRLSGAALALSFLNLILYFFRNKSVAAMTASPGNVRVNWLWTEITWAGVKRVLIRIRECPYWRVSVLTLVPAINLYIFTYLPLEVIKLERLTLVIVVFFVWGWSVDKSLYSAKNKIVKLLLQPWFTRVLLLTISLVTSLYAVTNISSIWLGTSADFFGCLLYVAALLLGFGGSVVASKQKSQGIKNANVDDN